MFDSFILGGKLPSRAKSDKLEERFLGGKLGDETAKPSAATVTQVNPLANSAVESTREKRALKVNPVGPSMGPNLTLLLPAFVSLVHKLGSELSGNLQCLLHLNPSRRTQLLFYLESLLESTNFELTDDKSLIQYRLSQWVLGPRSIDQDRALQAYLEEVVLVWLGQALVLKRWSDLGIRKWSPSDLKNLNYTLGSALKPLVPMDCDTWNLTRQNLVSWFCPTEVLGAEVFETFEQWDLSQEPQGFLNEMLRICRKPKTESNEYHPIDRRFFAALGPVVQNHFPELPTARRSIYSPTLKDGAWLQTLLKAAPGSQIQVLGVERDHFLLNIAELGLLWSGPVSPPVWMHGNGLEVHPREQVRINWVGTKPSNESKIAETEACDCSILIEDRPVYFQNRTTAQNLLRHALDQLPFFKRLRTPTTSLGTLQACVAVSKLRPSARMYWLRATPLTSQEGSEALKYLLDRSRLVAEIDLSGMQITQANSASIPRMVYIFERDLNLEKRNAHRPLLITVTGQLKSQLEFEGFLEDVFASIESERPVRANWSIEKAQSTQTQQDWARIWPDPGHRDHLQKLERLRKNSQPLGSLGLVRKVSFDKANEFRGPNALIVWAEQGRIRVDHTEYLRRSKGSGFLVGLQNSNALPVVMNFLKSKIIAEWLDCFCEKKNGAWNLSENSVRCIPIPDALLEAVQTINGRLAQVCSAETQALLSDLDERPQTALRKLKESKTPQTDRWLVAAKASECIHQLYRSQKRLFGLVARDGTLLWSEFLKILPQGQTVSFAAHPDIRLLGQLPPHLPIVHRSLLSGPERGLTFATEAGFALTLKTPSSILIDILWQQVQELAMPTWSELIEFCRVPRNLEAAQAVATDLIRSYSVYSQRLSELKKVIQQALNLEESVTDDDRSRASLAY